MMASALRSISETKSLNDLLSTFTADRLLAARTIMSPARRAALRAVLRAGFMWASCVGQRFLKNGRALYACRAGAAKTLSRRAGFEKQWIGLIWGYLKPF